MVQWAALEAHTMMTCGLEKQFAKGIVLRSCNPNISQRNQRLTHETCMQWEHDVWIGHFEHFVQELKCSDVSSLWHGT